MKEEREAQGGGAVGRGSCGCRSFFRLDHLQEA